MARRPPRLPSGAAPPPPGAADGAAAPPPGRPPEAAGRRLRRNLLWALALLGAIAALTGAELWLQGAPGGVPPATNVLIFALANFNAILFMALGLLVFRNVTKLYFERRRRIVGARFRFRLALAFVGLASLPAILLFLVSLKLITSSFQGWFDERVEDALRLAADLAGDASRATERAALESAQRLADEVARLELAAPARREALARHLAARAGELGLDAASYAPRAGSGELRAAPPGSRFPFPPALPPESLREAWEGRSGLASTPVSGGTLVRGFWPVRSSPGAPVRGAVTAVLLVPETERSRLAAAAATHESYREMRRLRTPIRSSYTLTLVTIALLVTFMATWFAFYFSRVITTPIQQLAEGTRRVAGGDLDFEIAAPAEDEIGMLVSSFNRMTRDLRGNRAELSRAYATLQRSSLELERRTETIETILETVAAGVVSIDPGGAVATCNPAAARMLGTEPDAAVGLPVAALLRDPALRPLRAAVEERRPSWEGRVVLAAGGQARTLIATAVGLRDRRGVDLGRLVVLEDITQLVQAQRAVAWREAARRIAHEIKNPLTPIRLSVERARKKFADGAPDREAVFLEAADTVVSQVLAMQRLVDEFSRFARLPARKPEPVDIREVVESAIGLYRTGRPGVEFSSAHPDAPLVVDADPEQLRRVFINLLENAVHALEGPGRIAVETAATGAGTVVVRVADTGRGLPPEDRERLFLPDVSTKKEGGGLGLAIVSDIVTEHGGTVRAEDNHPRGTVFILEFPLHRSAAAPEREAEVRHAG